MKVVFSFPGSSDVLWVKHCIKDKYDFYYNLQTRQGTWEKPEEYKDSWSQLSKEDIQVQLSFKTLNVLRFISTACSCILSLYFCL